MVLLGRFSSGGDDPILIVLAFFVREGVVTTSAGALLASLVLGVRQALLLSLRAQLEEQVGREERVCGGGGVRQLEKRLFSTSQPFT